MAITCIKCGSEIIKKKSESRLDYFNRSFCTHKCFLEYRKKNGVSKETKEKMSAAHSGKKKSPESIKKTLLTKSKNPILGKNTKAWKGGYYRDGKGYVFVYCPDHPSARDRHMAVHRLVVEKQLGRYLLSTEHVHHVNENVADNSIKNLMAFKSRSAHQRFHKNEDSVKPEEIIFDGRYLHFEKTPLVTL